MKKLLSLLLAAAMIFVLAACGNASSDVQQDPASAGANSGPVLSEETDGAQRAEEGTGASVPSENTGTESAGTESAGTQGEPPENASHILIAYFSRVGNTVWEDGVDTIASASLNAENDEYVGNAGILAQYAQEATGGDLFLIRTAETYPSDYRQTTDKAAEEQDADARPALSSHVENMDAYDTVILIYPNWWGTLPQALFTFLEEYDFSGKTILPLCTHGGSRMGSSERDIRALCPDAVLGEGLSVPDSGVRAAQSDVEAWIENAGLLE